MNNKYQQQLNNLNTKKFENFYTLRNLYPNYNVNMLENINTNNTGFLRLNIVDQMGGTPVTNATITIYVTDGMQRDIPVMHLITTINPILIALPMANDLGTLLVGPEYNFSTYNIRVDAFGYFATNIYNVRLFPGTSTNFDVEMTSITQPEAQPLIEERIYIPPHPRDVINGV